MLPPVRPAILLVDDDLTLLSAVARRVARAGYEVRTAPSGAAALKMLEGSWPALLVVDLMMPGMDAFELYAEDYVTKPFDPDELVARIQRVLRRAPMGHPQITLDGGEVEVDLATRRLTTP